LKRSPTIAEGLPYTYHHIYMTLTIFHNITMVHISKTWQISYFIVCDNMTN